MKFIIFSLVFFCSEIKPLNTIRPQLDRKYVTLVATKDDSPKKTYIVIYENDKVCFIRDTKTIVVSNTILFLKKDKKLYIFSKTQRYLFLL